MPFLETALTAIKHENEVNESASVVPFQMSCIRPNITPALIPPATGSVRIHARKIVPNSFQSTFLCERVRPTNTTDPTLQCVVLIGRPRLEAANTVKAAPISMQKPLQHEAHLAVFSNYMAQHKWTTDAVIRPESCDTLQMLT